MEGQLVISEMSSMPRIGYFALENYGVPCHTNMAHGKQYIHASMMAERGYLAAILAPLTLDADPKNVNLS